MNRSPLFREDSMTGEFDEGILRRLNQFVAGCSVLAIAFGLWVLTGWALHLPWMKSILPGQVAVKANTGACFLLIGFALWVVRKESIPAAGAWKLAARIASGLAAVVGLLSLMEGIWGWNVGVDQLLFAAGPDDIPGSIRAGLMSPLTAWGFFGLGMALLLLDCKSRVARWSAHLLPCGVSIASMFGILDFVLEPQTTHTYISPVTALVLFLLASGVLFARTDWSMGALIAGAGNGGMLIRRLLPTAILAPLIVGWLRWKGQSAGLYSDWTGVALMTVTSIVLLAGLMAWTAFTVDSSERGRRRSQETVDRLASIVECSNDGIIGKTTEGIVTSWNPGAEAIYGYSAQEIVGRPISIVIPQDRQGEFETLLNSIRRGQQVSHYETERLRKDGQTVFVSLAVSPVRDKTGRLIGVSTIARDVTGRKCAEEKLQQASLYARSLIEASLDPLVTISKDGKIMDVNRATEVATGVERSRLIGSDFCDYFTQPDKARQGYEQVFAEETVQDYPLAIRHASGRVMDVLYNASVFRNPAGGVEGVFAAARDITNRKRAEAELQESEAKFRALSDQVPQFVWMCTPDGLNVYFNHRWTVYTGLSLEESYGRGWNTPFHPDDKQAAWDAWNHAVATGETYRVESRLRAADGSYRWFLMRGVPLRDASGSIAKWFGTCTDIDDLKQAEAELRLGRERLALAQKAAHSGTFDWDIQNNVNRWSAEVEEVHGIAPGQFGGTYEDWEALVVPDDLIIAKKAIEESLKTGDFASEWRIRRRNDGEIRWITARAKVIFDAKGQPQCMLGLNMDVTERRRAEEEVRRLNQELEQRVIQRTAQLEAANKELEAFTYSVSHDLRAPLRHISGFSKVLTEEYGSSLAPDARHHLERIQEGTRRMGLLVDDLLNLGRIGRHEVRLQVTGLNSIVNETVADFKAECEGRQLEWKIGALPFVECDPSLMKQVFQNLLSNAVKFTRPRSPAVIEVGQKDQDGTCVIFVRDNGVGFNMKYSEKLFGVFQRLHRAEDFEGTGVGLATVQRIIQKHSGRIWAEAELDKGATFYFTLGSSEANQLKTKAAMVGDKA